MKEKRNPHPVKLSCRDFKVTEKSTEAGLRTVKQSESHTDHLNHWPRPTPQAEMLGQGLGTETGSGGQSWRED